MIELENHHSATPNKITDSYKNYVKIKCIRCIFTIHKWENVTV